MQLKTILASSVQKLASAGIDNPQLEAELLAAGVLKTTRADVIARVSSEFDQLPQYNAALNRRLQREPIQYIFGEAYFFGLSLTVSKDVLIPRPETELLVDETLRILDKVPPSKEAVVVDVGTGSGAIAIAIAANNKKCRVFAIDLSQAAVNVAKQNVARHALDTRITVLQGDLITPLTQRPDIVIANLPYVKGRSIPDLQPELRYEPLTALDGGPDGLDVIRRLWKQLTERFEGSGARVLIEHEADQAEAVATLVNRPLRQLKDLAGLTRVTVVYL
ncbi:MAG: peptide chain release factor N(5)-glutamine methyltransferase [Dehalococcoidia bacterium]|nr:peptide chain release factor N(5)-glutamine methyltransferase [Dehalococcoidia bacterium]